MQVLKRVNLLSGALLALSLLTSSQVTYAHQPAAVSWNVLESAREGVAQAGITPRGDARLLVRFSPWELKSRNLILVLFRNCGEDPEIVGKPLVNFEDYIQGFKAGKDVSPIYNTEWKNPGPRWRICPQTDALLVGGDSTAPQDVLFEVDFLRLLNEGVSPRIDMDIYRVAPSDLQFWPTAEELARHYRNLPPDARVPFSVHYRLSQKGSWFMGDYFRVYGAPSLDKLKGGKRTTDYLNFAKVLPVNTESFRRMADIPGNTKFDRLESVKTAMEDALAQGSAREGEQFCYPETPVRTSASAQVVSLATSHTITGRFSTKWTTDHSLHPGFGFFVEVYKAGASTKLGDSWVQSDGSWTVNVSTASGFVTGQQIKVYYRSYNSYYAPQNQDGGRYWWYDPTWTVTSTTFNVGHRFADTDGGAYNGVGELVDNAMTMWSRLYWTAEINPVPASAIKFYFPNTWNNCGGSSPWSCATFAGDKIWLIAEHGVQGDVVNHEMGHALQSKFWQGKSAKNSGGSHSLNTCYPSRLGMALNEGFANYIAAWVGYQNRNVAEGGFNVGRWDLGWDAEQRNTPPNCAKGWENEVWVARTFWDLHDTRADGDDILWFNHPGAVISLFLGNGVANDGDARDMRYYENIYRNAASAGHQGFITDIFQQNHH